MRNYLILILLIICSLTISSCGGGDGVTQPSSISTPISNDLSATGYIIIKVEWPQNEKTNKEQKSIISSMIPGTELIYIDVLDINGNSFTTPLTATIPKSKKEAKIDFIPATKVIVRASAYDIISTDRPSSDHLLSTSEKKINIEVGYNKVDLDLGHYDFSLKADPNTIYPDIDPGAELARQATITATLKLEYPPDPNDPNTIPTKPVGGKTINFKITSGKGNLSSTIGTTDPNTGECKVTFTWDRTDETFSDISIEADFQPDPNGPVSTQTCNITVPATLIFLEGFEYPGSVWPPSWSRDGNASSAPLNNCISPLFYEGLYSLQLYGRVSSMWGALAHTLVPLNLPYEIRLKIYNFNEALQGHHFRGRVAISSGPSWSYSTKTLLKFYESGSFNGIGISGNYSTFTWYSVRIQCLTTGKINYLIKQEPDGNSIEASSSTSIGTYPYLTLESGGGATYFDDIKIYYLGNANNKLKQGVNMNSSEWIEENIPPGEIIQELYDPDK